MAGSGKYVAIAASNSFIDDLQTTDISGLVFGVGQWPYCRIASKYIADELDPDIISDTAFCIDPGISGSFYTPLGLYFPNLTTLRINYQEGYTGSLRVVSSVDVNPTTYMCTSRYTDYKFKCGLFIGT